MELNFPKGGFTEGEGVNYVIEYAKARTNLICANISAQTTLDIMDSFTNIDNLKDLIRTQLEYIKKISE